MLLCAWAGRDHQAIEVAIAALMPVMAITVLPTSWTVWTCYEQAKSFDSNLPQLPCRVDVTSHSQLTTLLFTIISSILHLIFVSKHCAFCIHRQLLSIRVWVHVQTLTVPLTPVSRGYHFILREPDWKSIINSYDHGQPIQSAGIHNTYGIPRSLRDGLKHVKFS